MIRDLTLTRDDLRRAIAAREAGERVIATCVVSQAARRTFATASVLSTSLGLCINGGSGGHRGTYTLSRRAQVLMGWFDDGKYALLRRHLPATVRIRSTAAA